MIILNNKGTLSSRWYRKPTDTGLALNFHALAPLKYKKSVVSSFVYRIFRASSDWTQFHAGLTEALETLNCNQYPESFIYPIVHDIIEKLVSPSEDERVNDAVSMDLNESLPDCLFVLEEKDKFMFCINYRGKPTEQLAKSFKKLNAPCKVIMKTKKLKSVSDSLFMKILQQQ